MELKEILQQSFNDLKVELDIKPYVKSKRIFTFFTLDDIPHSVKELVNLECETIANMMGRKSFQIDHPLIYTKNEKWMIKGGIWTIRIF